MMVLARQLSQRCVLILVPCISAVRGMHTILQLKQRLLCELASTHQNHDTHVAVT